MDRIKAAVSDMIVLVILIFLVTSIFSSYESVPTEARIGAFVGIFFLYEPLMISLFGGTIGHFANGLRVKRSNSITRNIIFPWAVVRYAAKMFLGIISLFSISANAEGKAIHDIIVNSVVIKARK
ncbi:MAG: RDD family protein [Crocinitomicaceae bacterium]|nr:RDD family protein [Crocinitomicaceae bacterium]